MDGVERREEKELMIGVVYANPEGVRAEETERLFEVMHVDVIKYEEKGCDGGGGGILKCKNCFESRILPK